MCLFLFVVGFFSFLNTTHEVDGQVVYYTVVYDVHDDKIINIKIQLREWETLFTCPYTFKFRTLCIQDPGSAAGFSYTFIDTPYTRPRKCGRIQLHIYRHSVYKTQEVRQDSVTHL